MILKIKNIEYKKIKIQQNIKMYINYFIYLDYINL